MTRTEMIAYIAEEWVDGEGRTWHELKAPGIEYAFYVFEDNEAGRKTLQKLLKKIK